MTDADDLTRSEIIDAFGEELGGKLLAGGYSSLDSLSSATNEEILAVDGIGPASLAKIHDAVTPVEPEPEVKEEEAEVGLEEEAAESDEVEETPEKEEGAVPVEDEPEVEPEPEIETEPEVEEASVEEGQPQVEAPAEVLEEEATEEAEEELSELAELETGPPEPEEEELEALADLEMGPVEPGSPPSVTVDPPPFHGDQPQVSVRLQRLRDAAAAEVADAPAEPLPVDVVTVEAEIDVEEDEGLVTGSASVLDPSDDVPVVEETENVELSPEDEAAGIPVADSDEGGEDENIEAADSEEAAPEVEESETAEPGVEPSE